MLAGGRRLGDTVMRSYLNRLGLAAVAALSIATASLATSTSADARPGFRGHHHGFHGFRHHGGRWGHRGFGFAPAFAGALAFGAVTAPYWYGAPVGLYGDCFPRRRIVGYTQWGRPVVRVVRVCHY